MQIHPDMLFAGRYLLKQRLGTGGFSEVWLGEDKKSRDIQVALKIFAPGSGLDEKGLELFSGEYSLVFNLQHPGLLKPMHYDDFEGMPFFVMQYMSNGSCEGLVGKTSEAQLAEFMLQVSRALDYLHDQDPPIIHLDIKPENILINNNGKYLLADFGISTKIRKTLTRSIGNESVKSKGSGTPAYMAPERISKNLQERLPIRANDIFSLGVTMFEMLSGELPYGEMGGAIAASGIEPPDLPDNFDKSLNRILHLCIAREPYNRPTAAELKTAAESFQSNGKWLVPERLDVSAISEEEAWEKAAKNNNAELLKSFVKAFPNSAHLSDAHQRLEFVLWKNAQDENSAVAYADYLSNFENGDHAPEARERMEECEWKDVLRRSSDEAVHNYIEKYPNGKYKDAALKLLNPEQEPNDEFVPPKDEFVPPKVEYTPPPTKVDVVTPPQQGNPTIIGAASPHIGPAPTQGKKKKWVLPAAIITILLLIVVVIFVIKPFGASEESVWKETTAKDSEEAYAAFIADYPDGSFAAAANDSLASKKAKSVIDQCAQLLKKTQPTFGVNFKDPVLKHFPALTQNIDIYDQILTSCNKMDLKGISSSSLKEKYKNRSAELILLANDSLKIEARRLINAMEMEVSDLSLMLGISNTAAGVNSSRPMIKEMEKDEAYSQYFDRLALIKSSQCFDKISKQKVSAELLNNDKGELLQAWLDALP